MTTITASPRLTFRERVRGALTARETAQTLRLAARSPGGAIAVLALCASVLALAAAMGVAFLIGMAISLGRSAR